MLKFTNSRPVVFCITFLTMVVVFGIGAEISTAQNSGSIKIRKSKQEVEIITVKSESSTIYRGVWNPIKLSCENCKYVKTDLRVNPPHIVAKKDADGIFWIAPSTKEILQGISDSLMIMALGINKNNDTIPILQQNFVLKDLAHIEAGILGRSRGSITKMQLMSKIKIETTVSNEYSEIIDQEFARSLVVKSFEMSVFNSGKKALVSNSDTLTTEMIELIDNSTRNRNIIFSNIMCSTKTGGDSIKLNDIVFLLKD